MKPAAVLLLLYSLVAFSQQPPEKTAGPPRETTLGSAEAVSPAKAAKVRELIRITGTADVALDLMKRQIKMAKKTIPIPPKAQDDFANEFIAAANMDEFVKLMVPVYARHFSEADLDGMIAFYHSPLGQKTVKELPMVMAEAQEVGAEWGSALGMKIGTLIGQRVQAGEYGPWPPAEGSESQHTGDSGGHQPATPESPKK